MKYFLLFSIFMLASIVGWAQENLFTLSGGYSFANIEDVDEGSSGYRINGLYEFNPLAGKVSHGFSFGYIHTSATFSQKVLLQTTEQEYKIESWPLFYAPKLLLGNSESFKFFLKGALGMQFSSTKITTGLGAEVKTNDSGFYGGAGLGIMKTISDKAFIYMEYEWAYLSNSYYRDGFMNSVMLGVGMKF